MTRAHSRRANDARYETERATGVECSAICSVEIHGAFSNTGWSWIFLKGTVTVVLAPIGSFSQATSPAHFLKTVFAGADPASTVCTEPEGKFPAPFPCPTLTSNVGI